MSDKQALRLVTEALQEVVPEPRTASGDSRLNDLGITNDALFREFVARLVSKATWQREAAAQRKDVLREWLNSLSKTATVAMAATVLASWLAGDSNPPEP